MLKFVKISQELISFDFLLCLVWNYTARTFADWSMSYGGINVIVGPIFDYNNDGLADSSEILQK